MVRCDKHLGVELCNKLSIGITGKSHPLICYNDNHALCDNPKKNGGYEGGNPLFGCASYVTSHVTTNTKGWHDYSNHKERFPAVKTKF